MSPESEGILESKKPKGTEAAKETKLDANAKSDLSSQYLDIMKSDKSDMEIVDNTDSYFEHYHNFGKLDEYEGGLFQPYKSKESMKSQNNKGAKDAVNAFFEGYQYNDNKTPETHKRELTKYTYVDDPLSYSPAKDKTINQAEELKQIFDFDKKYNNARNGGWTDKDLDLIQTDKPQK